MRQARKFHVVLVALALLAPHAVSAAEPAWWTQMKIRCGLSASTAYNDWVSRGMPCQRQTYVQPQQQTVDDSAARAEQARIAAERQAELTREQMIANGDVPDVPTVPVAIQPDLRQSFMDRYSVLTARRATVVNDQATTKQQCDAVHDDASRYQMCIALVNNQVSGEIQNLGTDIQNFGAALSAAPLVASTPAPRKLALNPQQQAQLKGDRAELALLDQRRAGFERALDVVEHETESQRENASEEKALCDEMVADLISDSYDAMQSKLFMDRVKTKFNLSKTDILRLKEQIDNLKDIAELRAAYDAARAEGADSEHLREKLITTEQILITHALGHYYGGKFGRDLSDFVNAQYEGLKGGLSEPSTGTRHERIADKLDKVVGVVGAVVPELGSLHGGVNAVGDATVLYFIHGDSQSIRAAQQGLGRAHDSLKQKVQAIDAQRDAIKTRIDAAVAAGGK